MSPLVGVVFKKGIYPAGGAQHRARARANIIVKCKTGILYLAGSRVLRSEKFL